MAESRASQKKPRTTKTTAKKSTTPKTAANNSISKQSDEFDGLTVGKKTYGRTAVVAALVLIGVLAAPLGVAAKWAFNAITSQESYVALVSGLAQEPSIQQAVSTEVTDAAMGYIDLNALAGTQGSGILDKLNDIVGSLTGKDLEQQIETRIRPLLAGTVDSVVASDRFQTLWTSANQQAHGAVLGALENSTEDIAGLTASGGVNLDVTEIITQAVGGNEELGFVAGQVAKQGISIPLMSAEQVDEIRTYFDLAANVSTWAPIVGVVALIAALVLARKRWLVGLAIGATFILSAFLPSLLDTVLAIAQPAGLSGDGLGAQVGRHVLDQAVLNSADALKLGIPIGIGAIGLTGILTLLVPNLRSSK